MRISIDTNILLRIILADDTDQHELALDMVEKAESVILPTVALCEAAWVMRRTYGLTRSEVGQSLRAVLDIPNAIYDAEPVNAGLAMLDAGGDFADAVIAREGRLRKADMFVTFDRKAASRLNALGETAVLPGQER